MTATQIQHVGKTYKPANRRGLLIFIPEHVCKKAHLREGDRIALLVEDGSRLIIEKVR